MMAFYHPNALPMEARLRLHQIGKRYPGVVANAGIDLEVAAGEIHAVLGENGAGKSTLMKIIYGAVHPDEGSISWNGTPVRIDSPAAARALGIAMVFQHFSLFETLTVNENIALGLPAGTDLATLEDEIRTTAARYGLALDPRRPVHTLSVGERQRVEIVRALLVRPRLLILDEPTSVLAPPAVDQLFDTLRTLASEGCSILYISHKLEEIRRLCQRCTVLRNGRVTGVCDPRGESAASLSRMMTGADVPLLAQRSGSAGKVMLQVEGLSLARGQRFGTELRDISFALRGGEILGIAGISGNGQQELLAALAGEDRRAPAEAILLDGVAVGGEGPAQRRKRGLGFVPEERLGRGAVPSLGLDQNILLAGAGPETVRYGLVRRPALAARALAVLQRFGVKATGPAARASSLSGGNLQKFIVGREILCAPKVLLVAQPTWGVDVSAAARIRSELLALRDAGCALLVVSEELDELFELADRIAVMSAGRLLTPIPVGQASREEIGLWMGQGAAHV